MTLFLEYDQKDNLIFISVESMILIPTLQLVLYTIFTVLRLVKV